MSALTAARRHERSWLRRVPFAVLLLISFVLTRTNELVVSAASTTNAPKSKGVITLNAKNFDSELRDGNAWLIEFYAPW